jgi:hypothetical protein
MHEGGEQARLLTSRWRWSVVEEEKEMDGDGGTGEKTRNGDFVGSCC